VVTASIEQSTEFSAALHERGIPHEVLSPNNHRQEAEIISRAGRVAAVTVVTRMAGRGVDIRLGGDDPEEYQTVVAAGGLYVLGFDLFENRRLEAHMRGRAGRRGDPGESDVLLSLEDPSTAVRFSERSRRQLAGLVKSGPFDSRFLLSRALLGGLDKATQRQESRALTNFRVDEIRDRQMVEIYRLRDEIINDMGLTQAETDAGLSVIDELWCEHLAALLDLSAETTLHGLSGSAWEAHYRQEANRLFRMLRTRIDRELAEREAAA
jgi:preprotein translocase subunit SecA